MKINNLTKHSQNESFYKAWNGFIIASSSFLAILIPLCLTGQSSAIKLFSNTDLLISIVFTLDILINIKKLKCSDDQTIIGNKQKLSTYFKYWILFDIIAIIPFGMIFGLSFLILLRFAKLLKVVQIMYWWQKSNLRYANELLLAFFIYWMALSIHWLACGWLSLRGVESNESYSSDYISAVYWTITTITDVGYGDITPKNSREMIYASFAMLLGFAFYGYLIGNIAFLLSKKDPAKAHFLENIEQLSTTVKYRKLPADLQKRIYNYYFYKWKKRFGYDESSFLKGLPNSLKNEVSLHLKKEAIERIPLFKNASEDFIKEIALHLKSVIFTPGDYIFNAGDIAYNMYFVVHGELKVFSPDGEQRTTLFDGDFFGEIALFEETSRTASVKAISYCDLYTLEKKTFNRIITNYPEIESKIKNKAASRKERDSQS